MNQTNTQKLIELLNTGVQPVIEITKDSDCYALEKRMRTKVLSFELEIEKEEVICVTFYTNFSEFAEYNKMFEKPIWYSDEGLVKWSDSKYYPKDYEDNLYLEPPKAVCDSEPDDNESFTIIDNSFNSPFVSRNERKALSTILNYLWEQEEDDYNSMSEDEDYPLEDHIFTSIKKLERFRNYEI